ncbi:GNAT family N-acetyltransferase [Streptomyces sp. NPDC087300]|uniref:GNAT family N-acetyltransferase n=1 Tax=Streptomyces sp. NPDC087300 TaxID=3365780 RepID=UPI003801A62B
MVPEPSPAPEPAAAAEPVTLRVATEDDGAAVAEVYLRSFDAALPTVRRAHPAAAVREFFEHVVVPRGSTWIAEAGGETVGMMVLEDDELSQLYLAPAWRGRGIGDRFVALAKEQRPAGLWLRTFQVNTPAHRFYERHGFAVTERTDGSANEEREPDIRYDWRP